MKRSEIHIVDVFPDGPNGGNPAPIVLEAAGLSDEEMKAIAARYGHESGFVLPPRNPDEADFRFRFFVPNHEMEMCGHATIGALWLLRAFGRIEPGKHRIETLSGPVLATVPPDGAISITQPKGRVDRLDAEEVADVLGALGLSRGDLANDTVLNASTSRVKTLVFVGGIDRLNAIQPDFERIEQVCNNIGSTGLYPFAATELADVFSARQFPRSSGYPEDAATGIAASALAYGLAKLGLIDRTDEVAVHQGEAMGRPSRITVKLTDDGCLLSGICSSEFTRW